MKKYLKDLETELRKNNLSEKEIEDILADHEEMIESAQKEGLTDEALVEKFGDPDKLAKELSDFTEKEEVKTTFEGEHHYEFNNIPEGYDAEITLINEDIEIKVVDKENLSVDVEGKFNPDLYDISFKNNLFKLKRQNKKERNYFGVRRSIKFIVCVPKTKRLGNFNIKLVNGDAKVLCLITAAAGIQTNNGDLIIEDFTTQELKLNTVNGDVKIEKLRCENFHASAVSGDFKINDMKVEEDFLVNLVSGDVEIKNSECDEAVIKTVSGDLKGNEFYPNVLSLRAVSGDVKIVNTDLLKPIEVKSKKSVSGDIEIITK